MSCAEFQKFVSAFVDGELDAATTRDFELHRGGCAECSALDESERRVKRAVRERMRSVAPPADLRERIRASLDRVDAASTRRISTRTWVAPFVAAAAALALYVGLGPVHLGDGVQSASLFDSVADVHAKNLPVEVQSENPDRVAGWFDGKVAFKVHAPHIRRARLIGARLYHYQDRDAALLTYDLDGHRLTVLQVLADRPVQDGRTVHVENRVVRVGRSRGYSGAYVRRGDLGYVLVSDSGPSETARLAAQVGW